jgi:hypothetical protein
MRLHRTPLDNQRPALPVRNLRTNSRGLAYGWPRPPCGRVPLGRRPRVLAIPVEPRAANRRVACLFPGWGVPDSTKPTLGAKRVSDVTPWRWSAGGRQLRPA